MSEYDTTFYSQFLLINLAYFHAYYYKRAAFTYRSKYGNVSAASLHAKFYNHGYGIPPPLWSFKSYNACYIFYILVIIVRLVSRYILKGISYTGNLFKIIKIDFLSLFYLFRLRSFRFVKHNLVLLIHFGSVKLTPRFFILTIVKTLIFREVSRFLGYVLSSGVISNSRKVNKFLCR